MSLPGLGLSEPEEHARPSAATQHELSEGSEWRFEVAFGSYVKVQVDPLTSENQHKFANSMTIASERYSGDLWHRDRQWPTIHLHWHQSRHIHLAWLHD